MARDHWSVSSGGSEKEHVDMYWLRTDWGESNVCVNDEESVAASAASGVALHSSEVGLLEERGQLMDRLEETTVANDTEESSSHTALPGGRATAKAEQAPAGSTCQLDCREGKVKIVTINARSLKSDERIKELEEEAGDEGWDVILVQETWRSEAVEDFTDAAGHRWMSSGGPGRKHGVGILVHRKWRHAVKRFSVIAARRALAVDVNIGGGAFRVISAYFPHAGLQDASVEALYAAINADMVAAKKRGLQVVLGGDFNAEVGARQPGEEEKVLGAHGRGVRNRRGEMMAKWAWSERMTIANTMFQKPWAKQWTHRQRERERTIDYFCVASSQRQAVEDVEVWSRVNLGSDHRALRITVRGQQRKQKKSRRKKGSRGKSMKGWTPQEAEAYEEQLAERLPRKLREGDCAEGGAAEKIARQIESALRETARESRSKEEERLADKEDGREGETGELAGLFEERRRLRKAGGRGKDISDVSKKIQRTIQRTTRKRQDEKISKLLEQFSGLKEIAGIRSGGKKKHMSVMRRTDGTEVNEKEDIANVFADFYAELYASQQMEDDEVNAGSVEGSEEKDDLPEVTVTEVKNALKKMGRKKAGDAAGIVVEMMQHGGGQLAEVMADLFTAVLQEKALPPDYWKQAVIRVLHKSGDHRDPGNYRPICILPIMYKVFSKVLCERIGVVLDAAQPVDQAGFRSGYSCEDHLFTITQLAEQTAEYQLPLWVAVIDFKKAFDCVSHSAIWKALQAQSVPRGYVRLLKELYREQKGRVHTDAESRSFDIKRGTKQGDPLSPKLFNAVLQEVFQKLDPLWRTEGGGIQITQQRQLTNLRFADDVLLTASDATTLERMLTELADAALEVGLELHYGKTTVLCNRFARKDDPREKVNIKGNDVKVLKEGDTTKYLGRALRLDDHEEAEVDNRINCAWRRFMGLRSELCNRHFPLHKRLRLFNITVAQTFLYGSGTWTVTADRLRKVRSTQRRMIRSMVHQEKAGRRRKKQEAEAEEKKAEEEGETEEPEEEAEEEESGETDEEEQQEEADEGGEDKEAAGEEMEEWHVWVKRVTNLAREEMRKAQVEDWGDAMLRNIWTLAGHMSRRTDNRWSTSMLDWEPPCGKRRVGRPHKRWREDIERVAAVILGEVAGGEWRIAAEDREEWKALEAQWLKMMSQE